MPHHTGRHLVHNKKLNKQQVVQFDYVVRFFMVATPLFELPQAWQIYATQDAKAVSLPTWSFFVVADVVWLMYAIKLKSLPLQIAYSLYLIIEVSIVIGILLYS